LTQEQLAEAMGVSQSAVAYWERSGVKSLPAATVRRLAGILDLTPAVILDAMEYPIGNGRLPVPLEQSGLPPLEGEDLDKVIEYAWMLYERESKRTQPPTRRRAGGGSSAA
jgi:transcriptional regulator with XRE-family HTH domain